MKPKVTIYPALPVPPGRVRVVASLFVVIPFHQQLRLRVVLASRVLARLMPGLEQRVVDLEDASNFQHDIKALYRGPTEYTQRHANC